MREDRVYFDKELSKNRNVVEQACAWLDSFKALLVRFETQVSNWMALYFLSFTVLFIKKNKESRKPLNRFAIN